MQTWKRVLSCLVTLCLTVSLLAGLTVLTQKKDSYAKHAEFFEKGTDYDVFLVGSSRMMNGVFPMELWEHTGIASYNWAQAGHPPPATYWVMRLALEHKQPKLMVIDCYGMHFDAKTSAVFGLMHISLDSFPLSLTKIQAARDLLDDPFIGEDYNDGEKRSAFNLIWTFPVFHSRWSQLEAADFRPEKNYTRGAIANDELFPGAFVPDESQKGRVFDTVGVDYLRRAIEECQSHGIEVLMTFIPLYADAEQQAAAEYAGQIAAEYGVEYLNFFELDVVNYLTDFADSAGHLNSAGARKVTAYLGDFIQTHYDIPDRRGEEAFQSWERDHALYTLKKDEALRSRDELYNYLMLLERDAVDAALLVRDTGLFRDGLAAELLHELGLSELPADAESALILLRNGGEQACVLSPLPADGIEQKTDLGSVHLRDGALLLNGELRFPLPESNADLDICVLRDGVCIDQASFHYACEEGAEMVAQTAVTHTLPAESE